MCQISTLLIIILLPTAPPRSRGRETSLPPQPNSLQALSLCYFNADIRIRSIICCKDPNPKLRYTRSSWTTPTASEGSGLGSALAISAPSPAMRQGAKHPDAHTGSSPPRRPARRGSVRPQHALEPSFLPRARLAAPAAPVIVMFDLCESMHKSHDK